MRMLFTAGLICVTILVTAAMWISGNGFYLTWIPAGTEDGIVLYSPLWILAVELAAAWAFFKRHWWGIALVFAPAPAMSIDIYPAWKILEHPDMSLKFHIAVTVLMWGTAISGLAAYKYLNDF